MSAVQRAYTIEEFKQQYPNNESNCVRAIFSSDAGDILTIYYDGNYDRAKIASDITSYVYVNDWSVQIQNISFI